MPLTMSSPTPICEALFEAISKTSMNHPLANMGLGDASASQGPLGPEFKLAVLWSTWPGVAQKAQCGPKWLKVA